MEDLTSVSADEFQKCGELLVAAKKNKLAMSCNFCQEMFTQLHAFMRHLQIQHDNHLAFHKQAKEVEVYAVEELINQSVGSSVFDIENNKSNASEEDTNRLSEADIKWLDEGVEPNINKHNGEGEEVLTNMSILKALEDCDISFNLIHNINSTKISGLETESYLDNTLLQEMQNDCEDISTNKIILKRIDCTEKDELKCSKKEENLNQTKITYENSPTKCTKYLLQGLENLDDVDSLLENLETTNTENAFKGIYNPENNLNKNQNFNVKKQSQKNNCMLNTKSEGQILNFKQNINKKNIKSTTVVLEMNSNIQSDGLDGFETRFKEFANVLEDVTGTSNIMIKTQKYEPIPYISQNCNQSGLAQQLKDIEESHYSRNPVSYNIVINNSAESQHDFEIKLKSLGESFNDSEILEENNSSSERNISLNEDLTKALADALDEKDLDLLNIQQEGDEEPINDYILNLLERELTENEKRQELPLLKDPHILDAKKAIETFKKEIKSESCYQSNVIAKYQKTNLKVKTRMAETRNETLLKPRKFLVPTEFNSKNSMTIKQDFQKPLKGNHQKQLTSIANSHKSLVRTPTNKNAMEKTPENFRQIKIPTANQENSAIAANIQNIKKEILTPFSNFVNMHRGDKTPIKREQISFKQSPKTQEKLETSVKNITPQMSKIKQSPKTQKKQENFYQQLTLQAAHEKISQLKNKDKLKQSPKKISNIIKQSEQIPKQNTIIKEQKNKSPAKYLNRSNEKPLYNHTKTSLTTPNKLRNVAIKLHRYTPDKLTQQHKIQDRQISETKQQTKKDGKNEIIDRFKLPNGISLTRVPKQSSTLDANQCEITPIKTTVYWKQNFSEASLESGVQYDIKKQNPIKVSSSLIQAQRPTRNNLKAESTFSKVRQRKASIDILPSILPNIKQTAQISPHKTSRNSNLDYNSYAINHSAQKKEVLQRMHKIKKQIFKSIEERECKNKIDEAKSKSTKRQKNEILVENVQILPNLNTSTITPLILNDFKNNSTPTTNLVSPKNLADDQKQAKLALTRSQNVSSVKDDEKLIKKSLKRHASAPLNNRQVKRQHKSSTKEQAKLEENTFDLEGTQLDLSESVVDFLQRDLNANRLNVESLLNEVLNVDNVDENSAESSTEKTKIAATLNEEGLNCSNILNDLLEQVENEQTTKEKQATSKDKTLANSTTSKDFDDARDIDLLAKLGLKIIKLPTIEDSITLKERDIMTEKAIKFAGIYQKWPRIWSTKNFSSPTTKEEVDASFKQLLTETNQSFNLTLSIAEIKRVANLINIWYARYFNNKFIEKRKTSESINRYICIFFYVPRTIKRYYFCEYCPEYFNTEHRYFSHRITHTGALFPYKCQKCSEGFKTVKQLNNHELLCKEDLNDRTYQSDKKVMVTYSNTNRKSRTSEQSNEHTKKPLKCSYSCGKCKIVFAAVKDVENHMKKCNLETKSMAKPHTPRPPQLT